MEICASQEPDPFQTLIITTDHLAPCSDIASRSEETSAEKLLVLENFENRRLRVSSRQRILNSYFCTSEDPLFRYIDSTV